MKTDIIIAVISFVVGVVATRLFWPKLVSEVDALAAKAKADALNAITKL